ncbi:MAG: hypothetical protein C0597_06125 [Marinilabiliales bacterium]|nr:MAG: hypothetical protein C0597_06125 [Marinilabiliales bacterium]
MNKVIATTLLFVFSFLFLLTKAQTNLDPPILQEVSVISGTGNVFISWHLQDSSDVFVYRNKIPPTSSSPEWELITTITDTSITNYIDLSANANTMTRIYKLRAESDGYDSEKFPTTYLTSEFDTCFSQINLTWTNYVNNIYDEGDISPSQYEVYQIENSGSPQLLTQLNFDQKTYTVESINPNSNYLFYINLIPQHAPGIRSSSNTNDIYTDMDLSPRYINAVKASVDGQNTNLKFEIDPSSELETYKLLKSSSETGNYDTIEIITTTAFEINATDTNSDPDNTVSYYKLISANKCGVETTNSDVINNILLEIDNNEYDNSLTWNHLKDGNLVNYKIYRKINELDPELIGDRGFNYFDDNIENYQNYTQFCYYVQALDANASGNDFSQSNTVCIYLKPKVFIPEAFTPNGDGLNEEFRPIFSFVPSSYELKVYNRWGNILFETTDYSKPWNGKEANGNSAPTGAYIYYVKLKTPNDQIFEQRGTVMVIYP